MISGSGIENRGACPDSLYRGIPQDARIKIAPISREGPFRIYSLREFFIALTGEVVICDDIKF
jgi:hypothetical protein